MSTIKALFTEAYLLKEFFGLLHKEPIRFFVHLKKLESPSLDFCQTVSGNTSVITAVLHLQCQKEMLDYERWEGNRGQRTQGILGE